MGITYNKEFIKKNGRRLSGSSPRDLQKKQAQQSNVYEGVIKDLKDEISNLREELQNDSNKKTGMFTAEQVDEDINKTVSGVVEELTIKHKDELEKKETECKNLIGVKNELLNDLKDQNKFLTKELCKIKETDNSEVLNRLTTLLSEVTKNTNQVSVNKNALKNMERPKIQSVFIDPLETDAGAGLESHIDVEEVSVVQKENTQDKVDKLKNLLGSLKK